MIFRKTGWHTRSIYLKHIQETISLPYPMRAKYADVSEIENIKYKKSSLWRNTKTIDWLINCHDGEGALNKFENGYEEGRVMDLTGNLQKLSEVANELGYKIDFYSDFEMDFSDKISREIYKGEWSGNEILLSWNKPYFKREQLANIGGLIALHKSGMVKPSQLKKIMDGIKVGNGYDVKSIVSKLSSF